jgi:cellulose synthase/poly-beta-1,6-N-acetylglucosamine synthase-like glycosyltransferase
MSTLEVVFVASALIVLYAYVGFPLLTWVRSLVWRKPCRTADITPTVSIVVCCHNEAKSIGEKLENLLTLDYPADRCQIIIASDGSTDATDEIVSRYLSQRLSLIRLPRGGKAAALNAAVAQSTGEILVFSDANSMYDPEAIRELVAPLADETVGGVAGNQVYRRSHQAGAAAAGEMNYWDFDRWMKLWQSRSGHVTSATGAIYAIRRELFRPVPEGVTDDFVTSTRVIAQGKRLVFAPRAICYEPVAGAAKAEFGRKVRVITRGLRGVWTMRELLDPFRFGFYSVQVFSHKVLRRLVIVPLLLMAITAPLLSSQGMGYRLVTLGEIAFCAAALIGMWCERSGRRMPKVLAIPVFFCLINAAVLAAVWNVVRGKRIVVWNPQRGELSPATK